MRPIESGSLFPVNISLFHTIGSLNIALGHLAGLYLTTGGSNIDIGNSGVAGESATIRIGQSLDKNLYRRHRGRTTGNAS